jgi:hypothetical protein
LPPGFKDPTTEIPTPRWVIIFRSGGVAVHAALPPQPPAMAPQPATGAKYSSPRVHTLNSCHAKFVIWLWADSVLLLFCKLNLWTTHIYLELLFPLIMALGAKMSLNLSLANARLELLTRIEADLHAQFLEVAELRERLREAQLSADPHNAARTRKPAPVVSAAAA